jgi:CheY-like chemotaxis protein
VLVLAVFTWLVARHSNKLFAPSDFRDEDNYVKMQLSAVASLTAAATKEHQSRSESEIQEIVNVVHSTQFVRNANSHGRQIDWRSRILWVDDNPDNNNYERRAFEAVGLEFVLATSTAEALNILSKQTFAAIISDMGRREGPREGYVLLDTIRGRGIRTPLFFYASSNAPEHKKETAEHGGQGCTNDAQELFQMVTSAVDLVARSTFSFEN